MNPPAIRKKQPAPVATSIYTTKDLNILQQRLLQASFFNLLLVSLLGILLRSYPFFHHFPLEYKNVLHGHSHFAFGGWVQPILVALVMKNFPELTTRISYKHWRNIAVLLLASAYGMLLSFPFQGYGAVSIIFSTLSVGAGYYLAIVLWKALKQIDKKPSHRFLRAGLFFLALSAIGPFATGPLIALGKGGTPIYYNSIYFYLHFQYNGLFTFFVLGLLYKMLEQKGFEKNGQRVFHLFLWACAPAYFLSTLWTNPPLVFYVIGGIAAVLQLIGFVLLWQDVRQLRFEQKWLNLLFSLSLAAFAGKTLLQFFSAFPALATLAYHNRNFVIAYLHLVLLGFISLFAFVSAFQSFPIRISKPLKAGIVSFLLSFITTEVLLVLFPVENSLHFTIPYYTHLLFCFSLFFPMGLLLLNVHIGRQLKPNFQ